MNNFKILKDGTKLPLLKLKGKDYLQVAHRLVWFRVEKPTGRIDTQVVQLGNDFAIFTAKVYGEDGALLGSGTKRESESNFSDYVEKAETGAIGRALAVAGYGTQFEPEFDEGERIVDSPLPAMESKKDETPVVAEAPKPKAKSNITPKDELKATALNLISRGKLTKDKFKDVYLNLVAAGKVDDIVKEEDVVKVLGKIKEDFKEELKYAR